MTHKTDGKSKSSSSSSSSTKTQGPGQEEYVVHDTSNTDDARYKSQFIKGHRKYYFWGVVLVLSLIFYLENKAENERDRLIIEERIRQNSQKNRTTGETDILKDA